MALAITHIQQVGTEKLSLRALAREAGVSQTAPYRHFPTKRCLLAALATQGFKELHAGVHNAVHNDSPLDERFVQMGVAYVKFALANPIKYQLMFGSVLDDFSDYEMLHTAANEAFAQVQWMLRLIIEHHGLDQDLEHLSAVVWSGVHGMASLLINGRKRSSEDTLGPRRALQAMGADIEASIRMMYANLAAPAAG